MANTKTSMTLTGLYSGLIMRVNGRSGTVVTAVDTAARTGYDITTDETDKGKSFNVVTVSDDPDVRDPPSIAASLHYVQEEKLAEVDLDLRYVDIPDGTSVEVACSQTTFDISKQKISGSSLTGSSGKKIGPFEMSIDLSLWITKPELLSSSSSLTLSLTKIEGGSGGPVEKVLLEQIMFNLAA